MIPDWLILCVKLMTMYVLYYITAIIWAKSEGKGWLADRQPHSNSLHWQNHEKSSVKNLYFFTTWKKYHGKSSGKKTWKKILILRLLGKMQIFTKYPMILSSVVPETDGGTTYAGKPYICYRSMDYFCVRL